MDATAVWALAGATLVRLSAWAWRIASRLSSRLLLTSAAAAALVPALQGRDAVADLVEVLHERHLLGELFG